MVREIAKKALEKLGIKDKTFRLVPKQEKKELTLEEEVKILRKENAKFKKGLPTLAHDKFMSRRSIRKFLDKKVSEEIVYRIIEGASNSPCSGNIQNFRVIIVENNQKRNEIADLCFEQVWMAEAPIFLVVTRETEALKVRYPEEGEKYAIQNVSAVIQNILMLAHFNGLGACWVGAFDEEALKEILFVPEEVFIDAIIPIGYPAEEPNVVKRRMEGVLYFEVYGKKKRKQF